MRGIRLPALHGALALVAALVACETGSSDAPDAGGRLEYLSGDVDQHAYAVMRFDVVGADSSLQHLGRGVQDLLQTALNPTRVDGIFDATSVDATRRQALAAGAGNAVTGAVVGGASQLTIRATRRRTRTGRVLADQTVSGPLDSVVAMVTRLALRLELGEVDPAARQIIASTPLPAVEATLRGILAYRREEWSTAVEEFEAALAIDSTFGTAAAGYYFTTGHARSTVRGPFPKAQRLAWSVRHRMTAASRTFMETQRGTDPTRRRTRSEILAAWEEASRAYPRYPWIWNQLGYQYYWFGAYLAIEDWERRSLEAFQQQAELDGNVVSCDAFNHVIARQADPDPDVLARYADVCREQQWNNTQERIFARFHTAEILGDTAELRRLRSTTMLDSLPGGGVFFLFYHVQEGRPLTDWERWLSGVERNAVTARQRVGPKLTRQALARVQGRPEEATAMLEEVLDAGRDLGFGVVGDDPWWVNSIPVVQALIEPGWEQAARQAGERMMRPDPSWPDTLVDGRGWNNSYDRLCHHELARVTLGDTTTVRESVATLRRLQEARAVKRHLGCDELLDAMREQLRPGPETEALARLDSLMTLGPADDDRDSSVNNLLLARMYWARGDTAKAWHWVQRRRWFTAAAAVMPAWLRSHGLFGAAVGEREQAIRAYRHYLLLREDPEPALVPQRDSVLAELEALVGREGLPAGSP